MILILVDKEKPRTRRGFCLSNHCPKIPFRVSAFLMVLTCCFATTVPFQMDLSQVSNIINRLPTGWICSVSPIPGICAFFCAKYWTDRESELATRVNDGCGGSLGHAACW